MLLDSVCNLGTLVTVHTLEDRYAEEELFVFLAFLHSCVFDDVVECDAIKFPKENVCLCFNSCCPRSVIEKSKLSEDRSLFI